MNEPPPRSSRSIGWLRFIVWSMPTCIVPFLLIFPFRIPIPFFQELSWIFALAGLGYLAHFDALLECQQRQIPRDDPRARIGKRMATYILLQLLVVPVLWLAIAWGFCAITGFGF